MPALVPPPPGPPSGHPPGPVVAVARAWPGVALRRTREGAAAYPPHPVPGLAVVIHAGRPAAVRWAGAGLTARVRLARGDVSVLPPGLVHAASWDAPVTFVTLVLAPAFVAAVAREAGLPAGAAPALRLGVRDPFLAEAVFALERAAAGPDTPAARLLAEALARAAALHVLGAASAPPGAGDSPDAPPPGPLLPRRVRRVADYVRAHVGAPAGADSAGAGCSLARLAEAAGVSASHLGRTFRRATGESPYQFVIRARLDEAARLLAGTDWPVGRVALAVGYRSPSHFAAAFRRHAGVTPHAYRARADRAQG